MFVVAETFSPPKHLALSFHAPKLTSPLALSSSSFLSLFFAGGYGATGGNDYGYSPKPKKKSKWLIIGLPILLLVIVAAVLGGVLGSRAANKNNNLAAGAANGTSTTTGTAKASGTAIATDAGSVAASSAALNGGIARYAVATDAYLLPVYPTTVRSFSFFSHLTRTADHLSFVSRPIPPSISLPPSRLEPTTPGPPTPTPLPPPPFDLTPESSPPSTSGTLYRISSLTTPTLPRGTLPFLPTRPPTTTPLLSPTRLTEDSPDRASSTLRERSSSGSRIGGTRGR